MTTITTVAGDTFEAVSRRAYGTHTRADQVRRANPGAQEPMPAGLVLNTPGAQPRAATRVEAGLDEVALLISGRRFRYWDTVAVTRSIDRASEVQVGAVWEPSNRELREVFRPFSYQSMQVHLGQTQLFAGTMLTPEPSTDAGGSRIGATGYGLTGVLSDCTAPASAYPLEFRDQDLPTIAAALLEPFGLGVEFTGDPGAAFDQVALNPGERVLPFLAKLANQRNLVVGETATGVALFQQSAAVGSPVATIVEGSASASRIEARFSAQSLYSHVTGIAPTIVGLEGDQVTVRNPHLNAPLRPFTFQADDTQGQTVEEVTQAKAGRMFANMVSWDVYVPSWRDPSGNLWAPNTTLRVEAPRAMVYRPTELLVRSVTLSASPSSRTAVLNVVLPGAFAGQIPEVLPWDE